MDINSIALASERIKKKLLKVSGGQKPSDLCRQDLDNRGSDTIETHRRLRASLEFRVWTKFEIWALTLLLVQSTKGTLSVWCSKQCSAAGREKALYSCELSELTSKTRERFWSPP